MENSKTRASQRVNDAPSCILKDHSCTHLHEPFALHNFSKSQKGDAGFARRALQVAASSLADALGAR